MGVTTMAANEVRTLTNGSTKTVLVVEDNDLNLKLFNDLLEASGYNVLQTKDGMEALGLARQHRPDMILMDIQLPGISGLEVTRRLKDAETLKSIPVVAVTAFAMKGDEENFLQGSCKVAVRPISPSRFLSPTFYRLSKSSRIDSFSGGISEFGVRKQVGGNVRS
jgi:two-component system cell cycle response regulator DivK